MKRWLFLLSLFTATSFANEHHACCCGDFGVTIPNDDSCFHVYQSILYLRPNSDNLGWGAVTDFDGCATPNWHIETIEPTYQSAFNLDLCYSFANTGINSELNWTHLRTSDSQSRKVTPGLQWISPFAQTGPGTGHKHYDASGVGKLTKGHASVRYHFDSVTWNSGIRLKIGPHLNIRLDAGLAGIHLKEKLHSRFNSREDGIPSISLNNTASYWGVGPRFGIDWAYNLCGKFSVVGGFGSGLLFGSQKPAQYRFSGLSSGSRSGSGSSSGSESAHHQKIGSHSIAHTVPFGEANLGIGYDDTACGWDYSVEAGYMGAIYINPLKSYEAGTNVLRLDHGVLSANTVKMVQSNFSMDGPYARLSIRF